MRVPSITGDERAALELLAERAAAAGLDADLHEHDLAALRAHPDHPGEEAPRDAALGRDRDARRRRRGRLCLNGHVDVVGPGTEPWRRPWSGAIAGGRLHGRGAVDMKGAVVAALHALAALRARRGRRPPRSCCRPSPPRRTAGSGTFAALERDAAFDAALLPEPTGLRVVCAQAGALTFRGEVRGRSAHAAERLAGVLGDRSLRARARRRSRAHEAAVNAGVAHPLMRELRAALPAARRARSPAGDWSSQVPDRVEFEGRLGVPVGADLDEARAALQARVDARARRRRGGAACRLGWERRRVRARARPRRTIRGSRACAARCATSSGREPPLAGVPGARTCGCSPARAASRA